jgi:hypothetical protein
MVWPPLAKAKAHIAAPCHIGLASAHLLCEMPQKFCYFENLD